MALKEMPPAKYRLKFDSAKCQLCQTCSIFCSMNLWGEVNPEMGCMHVDINYFDGDIDISTCYQCVNPACAAVCPADAIHYDEERGCAVTDPEKCRGCGLCAQACPRNAIAYRKDKKKAYKCNLCGTCVDVCPAKALQIVKIDKFGREIGVAERKTIAEIVAEEKLLKMD